MGDWTTEFFVGPALDAWQRSRSAEETAREVEFLEEVLALAGESRRVLDVPCGDGRHAIGLVTLGHRVTGLDIAAENEQRARRRAAAAGVDLDIRLGDMRSFDVEPGFDAAYCMGNSFGYFPRGDTARFLGKVSASLSPGARFVLDIATAAESLLLGLHPQTFQRVDERLVLLLECSYDARESRLDTTYTSIEDDRVVDSRTSSHFVFTSGEIAAMLEGAGFRVLDMCSDLDGTPFELGAERLLVIAERLA